MPFDFNEDDHNNGGGDFHSDSFLEGISAGHNSLVTLRQGGNDLMPNTCIGCFAAGSAMGQILEVIRHHVTERGCDFEEELVEVVACIRTYYENIYEEKGGSN